MLVKEFKDFSQRQLRQLGSYANMTLENFIKEIESKGKYGAQNEAYMSRSAEKWVRDLCFNELGVCG